MRRIYISSSWRNTTQERLVKKLREQGHQVYDFKHPQGRNDENIWMQVTRKHGLEREYNFHSLTPQTYETIVADDDARQRFREHFEAMQDADTCILLLPAGRSAHTEAGYMAGIGKEVYVYDTSTMTVPELMYLLR